MSWSVGTGMGELKVEEFEIDGNHGQSIHFKVYSLRYVDYSGLMPVILTIHGISESKERMYPYNIELARRNFTVVSVDLSGHGSSQAVFNEIDINGMANDCYAAMRFVQSNYTGIDIETYGVLGNSFGFRIAQAFSQFNVTPSAYVAVGNFLETGIDGDNSTLGNLLISTGELYESQALDALQRLTGNATAEVGRTYGVFGVQTAYRLEVARSEPFDHTIVASTTSWLLKAIQGEAQYNSTIPPEAQVYFYKAIADTTSIISLVSAVIPVLLIIHSFVPTLLRGKLKKTLHSSSASISQTTYR